jgi:4-hydroxy-tetrahydrodipicolinate synthase
MVEIVAEAVDGDVPIILGSAQCNLDAVIGDAENGSSDRGQCSTRFAPFLRTANHGSIGRLLHEVGATSAVPIIVYNIPAFTHHTIPPNIVGPLAERGAISGIKDSSRDFDYFHLLCAVSGNPAFREFTGTDSLLMPALLAGGCGGLTSAPT